MSEADIGLIGLAVMGQNLALNIHDHGFKIAVFNRTVSKVDDMMAGAAKGSEIIGTHSLEEFISKLKRPRRIILMVKAGDAVDAFIEKCVPLLDKGDILIDGGNSRYVDTERRCHHLRDQGIYYIGAGISGGEEGARNGPSIMPGGHIEAWPHVQEIFQAISAKAEDGAPCCDWVGDGGAGHYVKMVHNGIEYGDMQLICEAYHLLHEGVGLEPTQIAEIFERWNDGVLNSYLIEITRDILAYEDEDGAPLVDKILDTAGQKGTGKWTGIEALDLGIPVTLIGEAVFSRCLSAMKDERTAASKVLKGPESPVTVDVTPFVAALEEALYASKIVSYAQGFMLMHAAADAYKWTLNYGAIAQMWRGGCIIRSHFLGDIKHAFDEAPNLPNVLLAPFFLEAVNKAQTPWRLIISAAVQWGIPTPCLSSALAFYDGYRTERLPANLLQAQRDYFGAHTYERVDKPRGEFFHTDWTGSGGKVSSTTYTA